ncbi:MAG: tetratricopeptide repeat protein [Prevotellaceae bacterium]|jgi:tetratricopeptide (TPR) repeat protein|nr:tetratricopeptide repeat protein [Prevotellaceae bacterium]
MKNLFSAFIVVLFFFLANAASAQGRYGKDSVDCVKNLSFYLDYAKQQQWKDAHPFWEQAFKLCPPTASQNLYIHGRQIMKHLIEHDNNPALQQGRIDTIMMLYDIQMGSYNVNKGNMLSQKAYDMLTYRPENLDAVYEAFQQAVMAGRENTAPPTMVIALQKAVELYQAEKLSADKLLEIYTTMNGFANLQVKANPDDEQVARMRQDLESILGTSGAASCDKLITMLEPTFNPQDKDLVIRTVQLLNMNDCSDNNLYYKAVEAYHALEPSPGSAYGLGNMYLAKGDVDKAVQYFKEAIAHPDAVKEDKVKYYLKLASAYLKESNTTQAIANIRQALVITPNDGKCFMLLGNCWAAQRCGDDEIAKKAVFWVAVDFFNKAKSADPSLTEEANKFINNCSQHFPLQEDIFFHDLTIGDIYTVNCNGLTEQTRVRARK